MTALFAGRPEHLITRRASGLALLVLLSLGIPASAAEPAGKLTEARASREFTDADYAQHIRQVRAKLPHGGFSIVLEKPFVVIGDEPAETVRERSRNTVRWTVERLKENYFQA